MEHVIMTAKKARISKELIVLPTYPYSDPSPVPEFGRLYPYNRFDGYTNTSTKQTWEMVVMENEYIKLWINPSVGGKIWGAVEKSTGKEFIYFNHTAKFRDVAMRGPWTSGGMEINMGIIGHSPSCSAPVDHYMLENADGSVSCFIGATDWPSRTEWRIEIKLRKDAAFFTTKGWWYNSSSMVQSYYQWNNTGIKTAGNLEYIFPGSHRLGHDGLPLSWPEDEEGRKIALYEQNNYGAYKSYHIFGSYTDFWGCYWHKDQFGMGHSSSYEDKPGRKIWIWGLSRYGMIWEGLLTDEDGQYTEVQSGRLFNQSIAASSKTPFKHRSFLPCTFDTWEEHWFPVKGTGGLTYGNHQLSFYISPQSGAQRINICANEPLDHEIRFLHNDQEILKAHLHLKAMENCSFSVSNSILLDEHLLVFLDGNIFYNGPEQHQPLSRPVKIDAAYDFNTPQALYIQAKEWEKQRFFERADNHYHLCLRQDPFFLEALTGLAGLYIRQLRFEKALKLIITALSVDTYHGEANYLYGLVNDRLNHTTDAKDGFSIASQSVEYRVAAFTELAKLSLRERQLDKAYAYAQKAQLYGPANLQSTYLNIIISRLKGNTDESRRLSEEVLASDPISYLARFELTGSAKITNSELPYETYIELAAFYYNLNLYKDAIGVLSAAPDYAMVQLWQAYLNKLAGSENTEQMLDQATLLPADFVFPHREEEAVLLRWAVSLHNSWKLKYYLALVYIQNLRKKEALELLDSCNHTPDFYPFYIVRAGLRKETLTGDDLSDLKKAHHLAPMQWRTTWMLSKYFAEQGDWKQAAEITEKGYKMQPDNYYLGLQLAKCFLQLQAYEQGISLLNNLTVLPNEGASEGRDCWRNIHLCSAIMAMEKKDWSKAVHHIKEARLWPENLGIGKPDPVDERLEDYMQLVCIKENNTEEQQALIRKIACYRTVHPTMPYGSTDFISQLLLLDAGDFEGSAQIMQAWTKQDPEALALQWAQAVLSGDLRELEHISRQQAPVKEVLPYEIPFEDQSFPFLKKLYAMGLFDKYKHPTTINKSINN